MNSRKTEAREHFHHWPHALKLAQQLLTVKWRVWLFLCSPTPFTCFIHKYAHRHARKGFLSKSTGPSVSLRALFSFALWEKKEKFSFKEESKPYAGVACEPMALDILYHRLIHLYGRHLFIDLGRCYTHSSLNHSRISLHLTPNKHWLWMSVPLLPQLPTSLLLNLLL